MGSRFPSIPCGGRVEKRGDQAGGESKVEASPTIYAGAGILPGCPHANSIWPAEAMEIGYRVNDEAVLGRF